jgi:glycosyltransferase involved in cell wall biosynthesis
MANLQPVVSVLLTAYNREKYIAYAIESVLASTFHNFELIIVDDCSKDRTVEIARKYEALDQRVKLFVNDKNIGDYPNRNKAASYATGKYIKYVDADDYLYPNGLDIIVNQMEGFPEAAVGLFSLPQNVHRPFPILLSPKAAYNYNFLGPGLFHKAPLSAIFRRKSFEEVGGFGGIRHAGDFDMWHRMAQKFNFLLIQDHIVWFREHDNQESKQHDIKVELNYTRIERGYIFDPMSPLESNERKHINRNRLLMSFKISLSSLLKLKFEVFYLNFLRGFIYLGIKK